ncbi:uncharacterized protein LOC131271430 isoform X2 [Anopheles coustani]|uniref:uncharacterized protein LOC131271430 isoform X2 n=1 Tax=Anopheles coustani TaxID=139045 RepID=UPI002659C52D|nr:uncharacterized protein LOC131271430 isoform X2 [Anopheles coustani]
MVFSSYHSTSYLPLDNDQSVTFYKNENRLFPTAIVPPTVLSLTPSTRASDPSAVARNMSNMSTTELLTAAYAQQQQQQHHHHHPHHRALIGGGSGSAGESLITGDCPFGRVQSPAAAGAAAPQQHAPVVQRQFHHRIGEAVAMCDDFQPVAYLNGSSNGYYGYVPSLAAATSRNTLNNNNNNEEEDAEVTTSNNRQPQELAGAYQHNADNEQNNNNGGLFGGANFLSAHRKRKEIGGFTMPASEHQHGDEEMDTNHPAIDGASQTKRRKTEPEVFAGRTNDLFLAQHTFGDPSYRRHADEQQQTIEMECQDQPEPHHHSSATTQPHPGVHYTNGFAAHATPGVADGQQQQQPLSAGNKSKYFDSNRCMMSHMI